MTNLELRESTGLSQAELTCWINQGLVVPDRAGACGRNQEFRGDQLERVRVLKALHIKGVRLSRLARVRLDLDGQFCCFFGRA